MNHIEKFDLRAVIYRITFLGWRMQRNARAIPRVLRRARLLIGTAPKEQYIETKVEILVSPQLRAECQ